MTAVTIFGPNLNSAAQRKATFHVHAADCGDCAHYGPGRKYGGEDRGWKISAASAFEATLAVYGDHLSDYGLTEDDAAGKAMVEDWTSDLWFAPCVRFAAEAAA